MNISGNIDSNKISVESANLEDYEINITFKGKNNSLRIGKNCNLADFTIVFHSNGSEVEIGDNCSLKGVIHLKSIDTKVIIGNATKSNAPIFANIGEEGDELHIGDNCLFANTRFRTSDSHKIFSIESDERINFSKNIIVENHVWIAEDTLVKGGAILHDGCVIGAKSLVTGEVEKNSVYAGVPAKLIRTNIYWKE